MLGQAPWPFQLFQGMKDGRVFSFPSQTHLKHTGQGRKTHCITTAKLEMSILLMLLDQPGPILHTWPNSAPGGPVPGSSSAHGLES